jgi:ankyrin repeat protein
MEEVLLRFPHLGEKIFEELDNLVLTNCRTICKSWKDFIDENKIVQFRIVKKYTDCSELALKKFCSKTNVETIASQSVIDYRHRPRWDYQFIGFTPLHAAAVNGHLINCQLMIENLPDKNPKTDDESTPLYLAAIRGHYEVFKLFFEIVLEKNPKMSIERQCKTPFHGAARNGHLDICQYILENLGNISPTDWHGGTPLHDAAYNGHLEVFKFIMEKMDEKNPKDWSGKTPFHNAAWNGHLKICELIVREINDDSILNDQSDVGTPLLLAASLGRLEVCKFIIDRVDDKNLARLGDGETPLHEAVGHFDVCKLILDHIDEKNPENTAGKTPLHYAAWNDNYEIFEHIFSIVQNRNTQDEDGDTPLHIAAKNGHFEICKLIVESGEDISIENEDGDTPLHLAAENGHFEICKLIVESGEDITIENDRYQEEGNTPLHLAAQSGHLEICALFLEKLQCKNPENKKGKTPLMFAKEKYPNESGHKAIVELIQDYIGRKKLKKDV